MDTKEIDFKFNSSEIVTKKVHGADVAPRNTPPHILIKYFSVTLITTVIELNQSSAWRLKEITINQITDRWIKTRRSRIEKIIGIEIRYISVRDKKLNINGNFITLPIERSTSNKTHRKKTYGFLIETNHNMFDDDYMVVGKNIRFLNIEFSA
ncbi:hypothetical protein [Microcystis phage Mel-JY01]